MPKGSEVVTKLGDRSIVEKEAVYDGNKFARQFRPDWTPINVGLMILFFATGLWVFGLAMIAYMLYGKEMGIDLSNWGQAKSTVNKAFDGSKWKADAPSGNAAFDDWRRAELSRLDEERRRLDESRREFEEYVQELRRARDQEEFNAFRSRRDNRPPPAGEPNAA